MQKLLAHQFARFPFGFAAIRNCSTEIRPTERENVQPPKYDKLFRKIEMEWQGHDPAVLKSYVTFVQNVCNLLEIDKSPVTWQPYQRTLYCALRSKFAKKKYKLHYEARTHIRSMRVEYLTGSTASTFLEYIQRNIPEGVGMKVTYTEMCTVPELIANATEDGSNDERRNE